MGGWGAAPGRGGGKGGANGRPRGLFRRGSQGPGAPARVRRPPGGARARGRSLPAAAPTAGAGGSAPAPASAAPPAEPATGGRADRVGVGRAAPLRHRAPTSRPSGPPASRRDPRAHLRLGARSPRRRHVQLGRLPAALGRLLPDPELQLQHALVLGGRPRGRGFPFLAPGRAAGPAEEGPLQHR